MRSAIETALGFTFDHQPIRTVPDLGRCALHPIGFPCPKVLLVGRNTSWGTRLLGLLQKIGIGVFLRPPDHVTPEAVREGDYCLILMDSTVSAGQRSQIAYGVDGRDTSLYYAYPVEHDCWWVPVIRLGEYCYGDPAFRTNEFSGELRRLLRVTENA